jgi:chitinase
VKSELEALSVGLSFESANWRRRRSLERCSEKSTFTPSDTIIIEAIASDPDDSISEVGYFFETTRIGKSLTPPYSVSVESTDTGKFEIIAKAIDNLSKDYHQDTLPMPYARGPHFR